MDITIRTEEKRDYRSVEEVTREAFWNLYCPGANEHHIIHTLRESEDFIPELTFVVEFANEIVGSIFYTKSNIVDKHGEVILTITFGPVSILPKYHRKGLGRKLIEYSIKEAKRQGFRAIIIGGYPYHYQTYGFVGSKKYNLSMPDGNFYTGIMVLPLYEGALQNVEGTIYFSEALDPDESKLDEFDSSFSQKEKKIVSSQLEFEKTISEIDND